MARSSSPNYGPANPAQTFQHGGSHPASLGLSTDDAFFHEKSRKRRRSNTVPDSEEEASVCDSPVSQDYEDDDTAIALQLEMDMDATIKTEPASQDEPMIPPDDEPMPLENAYEPLPFEPPDEHVDCTEDPFSFEADQFLERPEPIQALEGAPEETIPDEPAGWDHMAHDTEMVDDGNKSPDDDAASDTSELSAGFFEDARSDLSTDLVNLYALPVVKRQFSREDCRDLRHSLRKWLVQDKPSRPVDHFYHRFESAYTEIRFKAKVLTKRDRPVADTFVELVQEIPIEIFLVIFERETIGKAVPLIVKQLSDLSGEVLACNIPLEADNLAFEYNEPLGLAKGKFCEAGLLFVARDSVVDFLMRCSAVPTNPTQHPGITSGTLLCYLKYYIDQCSEPGNRSRLLPILKDLCRKAWETSPRQGLGLFIDADLDKLFRLLIEAQDWDFFEQAASHAHGGIPSSFFHWVNDEMKGSRVRLEDIERGLLAAVFSFPDANRQSSAVFDTVRDLDEEHIQRWMRETIAKIVQAASDQGLGGLDAHSLVYVITKFLGLGQLTELFTPLVERNPSQTAFLLGVVNQLSRHLDQLPRRAALPLFERLAKQAIDTLDVSQLCSPTTIRHGTARMPKLSDITDEGYSHPETPMELCAVSAFDLTSFIEALNVHKVKDRLLMQLAFKIVNRANYIRRPEFASLWWPFVRRLANTLRGLGLPPTTPRYLNIIMAIVEARLLRDVGEQPPVTYGRTEQQVDCNCGVCAEVNAFLAGESETVSILVPQDADSLRHISHVVEPTVLEIGCELEPRSPCIVLRKRFCDREAVEAFQARQLSFKEDLLAEKDWLRPVFEADGTSFDDLVSQLSNRDLMVTSAALVEGQPPPSSPVVPSQQLPLADQKTDQLGHGNLVGPQKAKVPQPAHFPPAQSHVVPLPEHHYAQYPAQAAQPVQHPQPLFRADFTHPPPASAPPQLHSYGYSHGTLPHNHPPAYVNYGAVAPTEPLWPFPGVPQQSMGGHQVPPAYPIAGVAPPGQHGFQHQLPIPAGPVPPSFEAPRRIKQEFPNPSVQQGSRGGVMYGGPRKGPAGFVDLTFNDKH